MVELNDGWPQPDWSVLNRQPGVNENWNGDLDWIGEMKIFGKSLN